VKRSVELRGELYLELESVAECYQVEVAWVREVYALGLLGEGERLERSIAIPAERLDRVAEVLRFHRHLGLELETIALLLGR
jgi:hypothetical protein